MGGTTEGSRGLDPEPLAKADILTLQKLFETHQDDLEALGAINAALKARNTDQANALQLRVVGRLTGLRRGLGQTRSVEATATVRAAPADILGEILSDRGLKVPDGKPLYRYRVNAAQYRELRDFVSRRLSGGGLNRADVRTSAAFALFAAEWFRRDYRGGARSWENLHKALGFSSMLAGGRQLTELGLEFWRRPIRRYGTDRMFLLTLAVEGGFPARLLESAEQGWLAAHLRGIIARLLGQAAPTEELALTIAEAAGEAAPRLFQGKDFNALCADLALATVRLRHQALAEAPDGVSPAVWLDSIRRGWRDDLPISLESGGARALIDDLISLKPDRSAEGDIGCDRLLVLTDHGWRPALRLTGEVWPASGDANGETEGMRLRVHPARRLAEYVGGELALIDPPETPGGPRQTRLRAAARALFEGFPLTSPVLVERRAEGRSLGVEPWPRSEALSGEVLAFAADPPDAGEARELAYVGRGSVRTRKPVLHLLVPEGFVVRSRETGEVVVAEPCDGRWLARVDQTVLVGREGEEEVYKIEVGASSDAVESLRVAGSNLARGVRDPDRSVLVWNGPPNISLQRLAGTDAPNGKEVFWRGHVGGWKPLDGVLPGTGPIEIRWVDPNSGTQIDKARVVVLPKGASIRATQEDGRTTFYRWEGPDGWRLSIKPGPDEEVTQTHEGLRLTTKGRPPRSRSLDLIRPEGFSFPLEVISSSYTGGFVSATGSLLAPNSVVQVQDLRGAVAFASGAQILQLHLSDPGMIAHSRSLQVKFEDDLSLGGLSDTVGLLLAGGGLDATVHLSLAQTTLKVGWYTAMVRREGDILSVSSKCEAGDLLEWRSVFDPSKGVEELARADASGALEGVVSADLEGPGIAFARRSDRVFGRPTFVMGKQLDSNTTEAACSLKRASLAYENQRKALFASAFDEVLACSDDGLDNLKLVRDFIENKGALPAIALSVFQELPRKAAVAAAVLLSAPGSGQLETVYRLQQETPLIWALMRVSEWRQGATAAQAYLRRLLAGLGEDAAPVAADHVRGLAAQVAERDDTLRTPLFMAGLLADPPKKIQPFDEAVQHYVRRSRAAGDAAFGQRGNDKPPDAPVGVFREDEVVQPHLRNYVCRFHSDFWEALDAPVAAALMVAGEVPGLTTSQRARVRAAQAEDPEYFREAFDAILLNGRSA